MPSKRLRDRLLLSALLAILVSGARLSAQDSPTVRPRGTTETPRNFGTNDYTVTVISAASFTPHDNTMGFSTSGGTGRYGSPNLVSDWYAGLDLPGGAVVDYIGLNSVTDTDAAFGVDLVFRTKDGNAEVAASVQSTVHDWDTDFSPTPISHTWPGVTGQGLVLHVQEAALPTDQYFGWVEIWWKRSVSVAPAFPTFNDVPTNHPFFQFVEALAASGVTGGCGNGNYCPDAPLTRGQMAVFLAKALGLHWPGATTPPAAHE